MKEDWLVHGGRWGKAGGSHSASRPAPRFLSPHEPINSPTWKAKISNPPTPVHRLINSPTMSNIKIEHREEYKDGELSKEYFVAIEVDKDGYYSNSHIFTREELEAIQRYEIPKRKETV